jgi:hypothetical protein
MNPNDFGKKLLVDQCQQIKMTDFIKKTKALLKETLLQSSLQSDDYDILLIKSKTGFGGVRYWFGCPLCHGRAGVLYKHPLSQRLGCRKCLKLDYRKRRFKGMTENVLQ